MRAYRTIRKLNPNVNLKYKILSCLKFPSLWYFTVHVHYSVVGYLTNEGITHVRLPSMLLTTLEAQSWTTGSSGQTGMLGLWRGDNMGGARVVAK